MNIKSIIFSLSFLLMSTFSFSQDMFNVKEQAQNNIRVLQEQLLKIYPDALLSSNQLIKLEKIYLKSNKEKEALIKSGAHKSEYADASRAIDDKYAITIASVLNEKQKIAFEKVRKMTPEK